MLRVSRIYKTKENIPNNKALIFIILFIYQQKNTLLFFEKMYNKKVQRITTLWTLKNLCKKGCNCIIYYRLTNLLITASLSVFNLTK